MEIPVLVQSLKSSISSSTSFQMGNLLLESGECCCIFPGAFVTDVRLFLGGMYEQPRCSANMVALGHGKFGPIIVAHPRKSFRLKNN